MFHGLDNSFLYSAYQLRCTFANGDDHKLLCTGTGFWIQRNDSTLVLVTNRHVLDIGFGRPEYAAYELKELRVSGKGKDALSGLPSTDQELIIEHPRIDYSQIPENDIACVVDPAAVFVGGSASPTIDYGIPQDFVATKTEFDTKFSVCDFVAFPGFPEWHDKQQRRPILRTGTISSDPRYDYYLPSGYKGECIAYEAFSYGGSSGSPVFALQKGPKPGKGISFPGFRELKLIGINAGHLPAGKDTHSGISYMYKASAILEILEPEHASVEPALTNG